MSLATNLISILITIIGYFSPIYREQILNVGIFALSGAFTNWIAIYMLFEKIPYLYGSGIIPNRFEEFKSGIKHLMINEFFTRQHIEKFIGANLSPQDATAQIAKNIDTDRVFNHLADAIMESSFGSMLAMFGGRSALEPLKAPLEEKFEIIIADIIANPAPNSENASSNLDYLITQVETVIDNRLAELTPQKVKQIIQDMIKKHLGWLVVWGGVFGGLIGLAFTYIKI